MPIGVKTIHLLFDAKDIGGRVREARKAKGLTQQQLAEKCGLMNTSISVIECGKMLPSAPTLAVLSKALGVPMDWIWFGRSSPF